MYRDMTAATVLLEPVTPYDTLVQVMDRVRVLQVNTGLSSVSYELFPDISIGDASPPAARVSATAAKPAPQVARAATGAGHAGRSGARP
jgi:hypothetical protein